jgi:hypothetical protein
MDKFLPIEPPAFLRNGGSGQVRDQCDVLEARPRYSRLGLPFEYGCDSRRRHLR